MNDAWPLRNKVGIVGVGYSEIGRRLSRPLGLLARDAALAALEDAGLRSDDLDGLSTFPDMPVRGITAGSQDGIDVVSVSYMTRILGLDAQLKWYNQNSAGLFPTSLIEAVNAICAGACSTVLVWRAMHMPESGRYFGWSASVAGGDLQYVVPYGVLQPLVRVGLDYRAYLSRFGAGREALGQYLVSNRRNAGLNPRAVFRDVPLTLEGYMSGRMIADPMSLLDCDMPVDGCAAFVLTRSDLARGLRHQPAFIRGYGQVTKQGRTWFADAGNLEYLWSCGESLAQKLWTTSGLAPGDMDSAQLYDGFSPFILFWLESLGFCDRGRAWRWLLDGRTDREGGLPVNTSGGSLGEGRLHGASHIAEAALQVTGRAGKRQVKGVEHVVTTVGQLTMNSAGLVISGSED